LKDKKRIKVYNKGKIRYYLSWMIIAFISAIINFFVFRYLVEIDLYNFIIFIVIHFFIVKNIFLELSHQGWIDVESNIM
jgi:hypothetical protein